MSDRSHSLFDNGRVIAHATVAPEASLAILSQREVNALCRGGNQPLHDLFRRCALAVLSIDLDHFQRINDTLGFASGNELLRVLIAPIVLGQIVWSVRFRSLLSSSCWRPLDPP